MKATPIPAVRQLLLVEDNPGDADFIREMLDDPAVDHIVHVVNLADAVSTLGLLSVDTVLLDLRLPDGAGLECVEAVRGATREVPIVVLTGLEDDDLALACIEAGAQDYIPKQGLRSQHLRRAIAYAVARAQEGVAHRRVEELELENRRVEELSRLRSEFFASMSHELRTPLNAIIGFSNLLVTGGRPDPREVREFAGHILAAGKHLLDLVNDVLDLAKLDAGKLEFLPTKVLLLDLIEEVVAILQPVAAKGQIAVHLDLDPAVLEVELDPVRFKQVLFNYLSNAVKFSPRGGRVVVRTRPEGEAAFRLEVEDDGCGIAVADQRKLFIDFLQLEASRALRHEGTGLGLALTRRIVEAQGGTVGVDSTLGKGSVFFAVLPRRPVPPSTSAPRDVGAV